MDNLRKQADMSNRTCTIDGCDDDGKLKRGWCAKHYKRWQTHGDPTFLLETFSVCQSRECDQKPRNETAKYCSVKCRTRENKLRGKELGWAPERHPERTCSRCGVTFEYKGKKRQDRYFCSQYCYHEARRLSEAESQALRRARRARHRVKRRSAVLAGESFDPYEIYERDGWRCGVCGRRVGQRYEHTHPRSVSLDHIVPLSKGGTHTRDNVQCSHRECNIEKRDTLSGQPLLIG